MDFAWNQIVQRKRKKVDYNWVIDLSLCTYYITKIGKKQGWYVLVIGVTINFYIT